MSQDLESIAATLVADGKGILAADESVATLTRRFDALGIQSTEQSRRAYREMLFTTTGAAEFISGAILYDETIRQKSSGGTPLAEVLSEPGHRSRHQGRYRRRASRRLPRGDGHRRARRAAGSPRGIPRHGRPLREMAGGHPHHRHAAERRVRERECARPRALRRALSGAAARADRRARSADERRAYDRALRGGHRRGAPRRVSCPLRAGRLAGVDAAQAQHGHRGQRLRAAGLGAGGRELRRSAACAGTCPRRCPASCSCRAARRTGWPPRI